MLVVVIFFFCSFHSLKMLGHRWIRQLSSFESNQSIFEDCFYRSLKDKTYFSGFGRGLIFSCCLHLKNHWQHSFKHTHTLSFLNLHTNTPTSLSPSLSPRSKQKKSEYFLPYPVFLLSVYKGYNVKNCRKKC